MVELELVFQSNEVVINTMYPVSLDPGFNVCHLIVRHI